MEELTKHHGVLPATWRQDLSAALEHAKPVITEALVDSINAANLGFTVSLKPWMKNQSESDLPVRLGKQDVRNDSNLLQIGELSDKTCEDGGIYSPDKVPVCLGVASVRQCH